MSADATSGADAAPTAFGTICTMEDPLATIRDLLDCLAYLAETMEDKHGLVVQRLAHLAANQCRAVEEMRCDLFRLSHPDRDHFEEVGWPHKAEA